MKLSYNTQPSGFTLIEVISVLMIIGIISAVVISRAGSTGGLPAGFGNRNAEGPSALCPVPGDERQGFLGDRFYPAGDEADADDGDSKDLLKVTVQIDFGKFRYPATG